jgi:predicted RNA-binding Zn ribbon-like protein
MLGGETSIQPGGRSPAPGELALVQAFMNSFYDLEVEHGADLLTTPGALRNWLHAHGLLERTTTATEHDLSKALAARDGLRSLAGVNGGPTPEPSLQLLNTAADGARLELRFAVTGPTFVASQDTGATGAVGTLLAIAARAMLDGTWKRLKLCPGRDCGWAFYDYSRNQAGRWCSMSVCGGREKARAHYQRRRGGD